MSRLRRQISYNASLSYMIVTSVCSSKECTHRTVLYGSTTAVATIIHGEAFQHETAETAA